MYKENIDRIDEVLNDEEKFSKYIVKIQNNEEIKIPSNLNEKILQKLEINSNFKKENSSNKVIKFKNIEILKVACFALFTVIFWNVIFEFNNNFDYKDIIDKQRQEKIEEVRLNVDDIAGKITTFFMVPTLGNERSNV